MDTYTRGSLFLLSAPKPLETFASGLVDGSSVSWIPLRASPASGLRRAVSALHWDETRRRTGSGSFRRVFTRWTTPAYLGIIWPILCSYEATQARSQHRGGLGEWPSRYNASPPT
ncbi:hypothetical protein KC325_g173 [Hortaea werneckii]|nr:hypothetical protein KC325_g173 [Hortaea werneckii]